MSDQDMNWYLDSGASCSMTFDLGDFDDVSILTEPILITTSSDEEVWGMAKGQVRINEDLKIEVIYVPKLKFRIISINALIDRDYEIDYGAEDCYVTDPQGKVITALWEEDGYRLKREYPLQEDKVNLSLTNEFIVDEHDTESEPENIHEVEKLPEKEKDIWYTAMSHEIDRFEKTNVWTKATLPAGKIALGTRWTYKRKPITNSTKVKLRARLVAQGFRQNYPEDFDEVYAPVIQSCTVRAALIIANSRKMKITHIDVDSAFLYSELNESIFIKAPPGPWNDFENESIYKLNKSMYGLRQAAKDWNKRITKSINKIGFKASDQDPCLFIYDCSGTVTWILLHVDDFLIISTSENHTNKVIKALKYEYSIKVLGDIQSYLGMHFHRDKNGTMYVSQEDKIEKLINKLKLTQYDKANTPMKTDYLAERDSNIDHDIINAKEYQSVVGSLLYIANSTRPDISFAVNVLSRHNCRPTNYDWNGCIRVVKYLNATKNYSLRLSGKYNVDKLEMVTYTDADWAGEIDTGISTTGNLHYLNSCLVDWYCGRQRSVALSTTEAEYTAATDGSREAIWLGALYQELGVTKPFPVTLKCDNQSCVQLAYSFKTSKRVRHIQIKINFLRELVDCDKVIMRHCGTKDMWADILTKSLPQPKHNEIREHLGVINISHNGGDC